MNKLKPIVSSTLILFFGTLVLVDSANRNYSGTLMDKTCSSSASSPEKVAKHTKECALMESCAPDGYGIVLDGKFIKFDENGDKLASQWLAKTEKPRDLKIEVTGTMKGDFLIVETMK